MKLAVTASSSTSLAALWTPLIPELLDRGHEVHTLAPPMLDPQAQDPATHLEALGAEHHLFPLRQGGLNPLADFTALFHLKEIYGRIRPDCVISSGIKPVTYGSLGARLAHVRRVASIVTDLGSTLNRSGGFRGRIRFNVAKGMYRAGLRSCDRVIFRSGDDRNVFDQLKVVPDHARVALMPGFDPLMETFSTADMVEELLEFLN